MIHREGIRISVIVFLVLLALNVLAYRLIQSQIFVWTIQLISVLLMLFILRFFRDPKRKASFLPGLVYAPADGKVVVVEETTEDEYFKDGRIQVSIFMSVWNVHINWFPCKGSVSYYKYHPGKYLVARHPKSSVLNERNTVVLKTEKGSELLIRQIAGAVARRIISYASPDKKVKPGDELGFIRFGSRVDVFFPPGSKILVKPGDTVKGLQTPLGDLK